MSSSRKGKRVAVISLTVGIVTVGVALWAMRGWLATEYWFHRLEHGDTGIRAKAAIQLSSFPSQPTFRRLWDSFIRRLEENDLILEVWFQQEPTPEWASPEIVSPDQELHPLVEEWNESGESWAWIEALGRIAQTEPSAALPRILEGLLSESVTENRLAADMLLMCSFVEASDVVPALQKAKTSSDPFVRFVMSDLLSTIRKAQAARSARDSVQPREQQTPP